MSVEQITQGTALNLIMTVTDENGTAITTSMVSDVDWYFGGIYKSYANTGGITYSAGTQKWTVVLNQGDTFQLKPGFDKPLARFKFNDGQIIECWGDQIQVIESKNKVRL